MDSLDYSQQVTIEYCDSRGKRKDRRVIPSHIEFRATETHDDPRWVMIAYDLDQCCYLMFSMNRVLKWKSMRPAYPI